MSHKLQVKQVDFINVQQDITKIKVLVIDDAGNVYWNDVAGGGTYTNEEPVPVTIGGILAGSTFNNVPMQDMWTALLYPYQVPEFLTFTVSGSSTNEVGQALPLTLSFTWNSSNDDNVQPNSIRIYDVTGNLLTGQLSDGVNVSYTYATAVVRTSTGSYTWTIEGQTTKGSNYIKTASKNWYWRIYWGTSSSTLMPSESFIESLLNKPLLGSRAGTYQFLGNDYKYLAIPNQYGVPNSIMYNGLPFALADSTDGYLYGSGNITYTQVTITNSFGQSETYNVFRSKNPLVGAVYMLVS